MSGVAVVKLMMRVSSSCDGGSGEGDGGGEEARQGGGRQETVAWLLESCGQTGPGQELPDRRPLLDEKLEWGLELGLANQRDGAAAHRALGPA